MQSGIWIDEIMIQRNDKWISVRLLKSFFSKYLFDLKQQISHDVMLMH